MLKDEPLSVLFLWHQHQPFYKDPLSNRYELPWVRLHATKDYFDMVALLEEFPRIKANFNLVPSLLAQLDDYAQGKANDRFIELTMKPATDLSFDDRQFVLENFFMANWPNMIDPHPRYRELLDKRGRNAQKEDLARTQQFFREQDWRDLQVWFNLAWFDPLWRERDPFIRALYDKGKGFAEEEKTRLVAKQLEICGLIAQKHREMMEKGQIEITATPYYHPILPLLCDTEASRTASPQIALPSLRFQHSEDARHQIEQALRDHERRFGQRPKGMWPSEGSVSEETATLFAECGVRWIATDEAVLANSIDPAPYTREDLYKPYRWKAGDRDLHFFFRDHELSDAIGFVYTSWSATDAVEDFMKRLHGIRDRLIARGDNRTSPKPVVPVILDGENCWEYYKSDGLPFLRLLYERLSNDPHIQTVRGTDFLDQAGDAAVLPKIWSGSWINANFAIWIGHREDNQAWDLLSRTRQFLVEYANAHPEQGDSPPLKSAWESIYIAEGSDWCWWYGDDHSSANDETFDYLFRKHLMNVYAIVGEKIPEYLHLPIKWKKQKAPVHPPVDFVTPQMDGKVTSYFEWQGAGFYETEAGKTGTMHRAQNFIKGLYYGFDLQNLYFRIDPSRPLDPSQYPDLTLVWIFLEPANKEIRCQIDPDGQVRLNLNSTRTPAEGSEARKLPPGRAAKIIEIAIPIDALKAEPTIPLQCILVVYRGQSEQERWPLDTTISIPYPTAETFAESWTL